WAATFGHPNQAASARREPPAAVLAKPPLPHLRLFSMRQEFPAEWYRFLHQTEATPPQHLALDLPLARFPFQPPGKTTTVQKMIVLLKFKDGVTYPGDEVPELQVVITSPKPSTMSAPLTPDSNGVPQAMIPSDTESWNQPVGTQPPYTWSFVIMVADGTAPYRLTPDLVEDMLIICQYSI